MISGVLLISFLIIFVIIAITVVVTVKAYSVTRKETVDPLPPTKEALQNSSKHYN